MASRSPSLPSRFTALRPSSPACPRRAPSHAANPRTRPSASPELQGDASQLLATLSEEDRRLAELDAALAEQERSLRLSPALPAGPFPADERAQLKALLEKSEAEAAALRALVTAGRLDADTLLQPTFVSAPTVRKVFDWQDVDWPRLSLAQRCKVLWDIVAGKTLDEWRGEWAVSRAEGFGLRAFSTLLLPLTVALCLAYALVTAATGGPAAALTALPFALPTSTLMVLTRVCLSSLLILVEQLCTLLYYMPAGAVALLAACALAYRRRCALRGERPFWVPEKERPEKQIVLLKRIPAPVTPPVYYRGASLPDAISELAERTGAAWPPRPSTPAVKTVRVGFGQLKQILAQQAGKAAASLKEAGEAGEAGSSPSSPKSNSDSPGRDWRMETLDGALARASAGARQAPPAAGAAESLLRGKGAAGKDSGPLAEIRARSGAMEGLLREGAAQASRAAKQD